MERFGIASRGPFARRLEPVRPRHGDCDLRCGISIREGRTVLLESADLKLEMEGPQMALKRRLAATALAILFLASASLLAAQENGTQTSDKESERLDALAQKLTLTDNQKKRLKEIYGDFDKKADPLIRKLCTLRGDQWQALDGILDDRQRGKLKDILKAQGAKELQSIVQKLALSDEQTKKVEKSRKAFWDEFLDLSVKRPENMARQYRELHAKAVDDARAVLTPEQRIKLPPLQHQDFDDWHDFIYRHDHLKAIGEQLGLSAAQQTQLKQLCAANEVKSAKLRSELKQVCKEECAALEMLLNAAQRARLEEVFPLNFLQMEHPAAEKGPKE
jgi:Spy/CpxP family protein refolding chaperone